MKPSVKANLAAFHHDARLVFDARHCQLVGVRRPHPEQRRQSPDAAKFRLQRRRRPVRVRGGLWRRHHPRQDGAGARLRRRRDAHLPPRLAALRRLCRAVRDLYRHHRLCRLAIDGAGDHPRIQHLGHSRASAAHPGPRPRAPGRAAEPRPPATDDPADGVLSVCPMGFIAAAEPDAGGIGRALRSRRAGSSGISGSIRTRTGPSIRCAGRC